MTITLNTPADDARHFAAVARCLADHLTPAAVPCGDVIGGRTCAERWRLRPHTFCPACAARHHAAACAEALEGVRRELEGGR